jgi:hypothetical protein
MGRDYVSEVRPPTGLLFILGWCFSIENHCGMISTRENSGFVHKSSLAILPSVSLPCSKELATGPYHEPDESNPCYLIPLRYDPLSYPPAYAQVSPAVSPFISLTLTVCLAQVTLPQSLDHSNIWWRIQVTEILIMQLSPTSCYVTPLRSK